MSIQTVIQYPFMHVAHVSNEYDGWLTVRYPKKVPMNEIARDIALVERMMKAAQFDITPQDQPDPGIYDPSALTKVPEGVWAKAVTGDSLFVSADSKWRLDIALGDDEAKVCVKYPEDKKRAAYDLAEEIRQYVMHGASAGYFKDASENGIYDDAGYSIALDYGRLESIHVIARDAGMVLHMLEKHGVSPVLQPHPDTIQSPLSTNSQFGTYKAPADSDGRFTSHDLTWRVENHDDAGQKRLSIAYPAALAVRAWEACDELERIRKGRLAAPIPGVEKAAPTLPLTPLALEFAGSAPATPVAAQPEPMPGEDVACRNYTGLTRRQMDILPKIRA